MPVDLDDLLARANAGDPQAQYALGNVFQEGLEGQLPNIDEAISWYQKAADQQHQDALFNLGLIGLRVLPAMGRNPRSDIAIPALEQACQLGDEQACCLLAESLITGDGGVPIDREKGAKLLEKAGRDGSTLAMNKIGQYLMEGRYLEQNQKRANAWFKRAAEAKDPNGRFNLAVSLANGLGIKANEAMARKLFRAAANDGHLSAKFNYAAMLISGIGGETDLAEGDRLIFEAAEQGDAQAQYEAGQAYRMGRRVPQDDVAALRWYSLAAAQDHPDGLFCMGMCAQHGHGMMQDPVAAENYYTRAAMGNHGGAAHNLGIMYVRGEEIPQNINLARELFEFAISLGEDDAMFSLGLFEANMGNPEDALMWGLLSKHFRPEGNGQGLIDHSLPQLTQEQITSAENRAANWERTNKVMAFHVQRR